ncbi:hypothetical protein MRX96_059610 [Rhipicephalus microplus]
MNRLGTGFLRRFVLERVTHERIVGSDLNYTARSLSGEQKGGNLWQPSNKTQPRIQACPKCTELASGVASGTITAAQK